MPLHSFTRSLKNAASADKPNEDAFIADDDHSIYLVADGVTSTPKSGTPYPNPSGGQMAAELYCRTVHARLLESSPLTPPALERSLLCANQAIFALNQAHQRYELADFWDEDYYGTVGTAAVVLDGKLVVAHLGDTLLLARRGNTFVRVTESQTQAVSAYQKRVRAGGNISPRDLAVQVRRDIRNNPQARSPEGEALGYGVFTGEKGVADFIRIYELPIHPDSVFLLLSDGLEPAARLLVEEPAQAAGFCGRLATAERCLDWLFEKTFELEKRSDDKTALLLTAA